LQLRALILAGLVAIGPGVHAQQLPDLGDASSATLSESQERTIGDRIMRDVRVDPAYVDDPEISDYINSLGQRLLAAADPPRPKIDFFVVNDDTINAFALVGGHIGVHSGLIALTQNESELAGVVAHEIGHILQKHQARMLHGQRTAQWTSLAALALAMLASRSGGAQGSQVTEAALASAGALQIQSQLDYTREHEREADRVGIALMERAGFDPHGMVSFFERLLRANRLNEFKGAPSYLRTHPLTTERIADMQDRVQKQGFTFSMRAADAFDYKIARARIQAMTGAPAQAVEFFKTRLEDQTVVRPREDVYGLAVAQRRARDLDGALKTLQPLRDTAPSNPAFALLAGQIKGDMGKSAEAIEIYKAALSKNATYRGLVYAYLDQLVEMGHDREALADLNERLRTSQEDWKLYDIQARAYEHVGQNLAQHRALAESYYRRGNLSAAVDQLEIAVKAKGSDFYDLSSAESRLREMRAALEIQRAAEKALNIS
jgi:predicted Zn-dependent protease